MDLSKIFKENKEIIKRGAIMRNKDIKMLIKKAALKSMPEVIDKIDLDLVMDDYIERPLKRKSMSINFTKVLKFASLILLFSITSIFIYQQLQNPSSEIMAMETEAELIGFPAISGATLLDELTVSDLSMDVALPIEMMPQTTLIEDELNSFNRYMMAMETMIGDKTGLSYAIEDINLNQYTKKLVYSSTDLLGNPLEYSLMYHMELTNSETNEYTLYGVITIGENDYLMEGSLRKNGKVSQVRWKVMLDDNTYIRIEDMSTSSSQLFRYQTFEDGVQTSSMQMQLSLVNNKVLGKLETASNDVTVSYQMNRNRHLNSIDTVAIQYTYQKGNITESGDIDVNLEETSEGQYEYRYQIKMMGSNTVISEYRGPRDDFSNKDSNPGNNHNPNSGDDNSPGNGGMHKKGRLVITNQI